VFTLERRIYIPTLRVTFFILQNLTGLQSLTGLAIAQLYCTGHYHRTFKSATTMATLNLPLRPAAAAALPPMPVNQARGNYPASLTTYTYVCGYVRPAVGVPTKKLQVKPTNPSYHCPQCDSEFSRPFSVKQHFPRCVRRWGNPLGLSWDDHQSCTGWCRGEEDWRLTLDWTRRETDDQQKDMQAMAAAQQQVSSQTPQVDLTQPGATSVKQEGYATMMMGV